MPDNETNTNMRGCAVWCIGLPFVVIALTFMLS
jgi:hypothetical protein